MSKKKKGKKKKKKVKGMAVLKALEYFSGFLHQKWMHPIKIGCGMVGASGEYRGCTPRSGWGTWSEGFCGVSWIIKYKGGVKRGMVIIEVRPEGYTTSCAIFVPQIVFRRSPWFRF